RDPVAAAARRRRAGRAAGRSAAAGRTVPRRRLPVAGAPRQQRTHPHGRRVAGRRRGRARVAAGPAAGVAGPAGRGRGVPHAGPARHGPRALPRGPPAARGVAGGGGRRRRAVGLVARPRATFLPTAYRDGAGPARTRAGVRAAAGPPAPADPRATRAGRARHAERAVPAGPGLVHPRRRCEVAMMSPTRRTFLGLSGAAAVTAVLAAVGSDWFTGNGTGSHGALLPSRVPLPEPFTTALPIPREITPTDGVVDLVARRSAVEVLPGRTTEILGYDGTFPGPTIRARAGEPLRVRLRNELDLDTVLHLHGGVTPPEHDGYPTDVVVPGTVRDYDYPLGQRAAPLWYHDHAMDFTGPNVYAGLAGMALLTDDEEEALGLPSGERDIPLVICDRSFDADGAFAYPLIDPSRGRPGVELRYHDGLLGDCVLVNGAPWPVLEVDAARYRFRLLNASNARRYELALDQGATFTQVGTDLGLLEKPWVRSTLPLAGAERADVVVDFSDLPVGTEVTMTNRLDGGGPGQVMRFRVVRTASDDSR